jgi:hypothetical protein
MKTWVTALFIAALICGAQANAAGADQPSTAKKSVKAASEKGTTIKGKIKTIDKIAKTFTLEGDNPKVLQITSETRITKKGKPATSDDLAVGQDVTVQVKELPNGKLEALTIKERKASAAAKSKKKSSPGT